MENDSGIILFKFSEQRWIDKLIDGDLNFSCTGAFIKQATTTGNDIQGDAYEAVFAHIPKEDERIKYMRFALADDLEIIPDGNYVFLRRLSAKKKPIFCFYGYKAGDILQERPITELGENEIEHTIDNRMYEGFADSLKIKNVIADSHRFTQLTILPQYFVDRVKKAMSKKGYGYKMSPVIYDISLDKEFFIPPTKDYDELFHKRIDYGYQFETRIVLKNKMFDSIWERFSVDIGKMDVLEYKKTFESIYLKFQTVISKKNVGD